MTNQMQGEILYAGWEGGGTPTAVTWAYTPWIQAASDFATFGLEVLVFNGAFTLTWEVQTRTAEDPSTTATIATPAGVSAPGLFTTVNTTACKDWVRFRYSTGTTISASNYVVLRDLQPSWQADRESALSS